MSPIKIEQLQTVLDANKGDLVDALCNYFTWEDVRLSGTQRKQEGRSGALFETFGGRGDTGADANRFTYADCFAPSFLSVNIPPKGAYHLVQGDLSSSTAQKLAGIPTNAVLDLATWSQLEPTVDSLFKELKSIRNIGWVGASKLLARKRPALIPVLDNVLYHAFDLSTREHAKVTWKRIAEFVSDPGINASLAEIRLAAISNITSGNFTDVLILARLSTLSVIRVLDICVWEEHHKHVEDTPDTCFFEF